VLLLSIPGAKGFPLCESSGFGSSVYRTSGSMPEYLVKVVVSRPKISPQGRNEKEGQKYQSSKNILQQ